jgi:hypothetical protein
MIILEKADKSLKQNIIKFQLPEFKHQDYNRLCMVSPPYPQVLHLWFQPTVD